MKKSLIPLMLGLLVTVSCGQEQPVDVADPSAENSKLATMYHDLDPANIDVIFTEDFTGRGENGHTWDRESHREFLSNGRYKVDEISRQIAEGDLVATMFTRTMEYGGDTVSAPMMHFKRFEDGKIVEVWEYYDYQEDSDEEESEE